MKEKPFIISGYVMVLSGMKCVGNEVNHMNYTDFGRLKFKPAPSIQYLTLVLVSSRSKHFIPANLQFSTYNTIIRKNCRYGLSS